MEYSVSTSMPSSSSCKNPAAAMAAGGGDEMAPITSEELGGRFFSPSFYILSLCSTMLTECTNVFLQLHVKMNSNLGWKWNQEVEKGKQQ